GCDYRTDNIIGEVGQKVRGPESVRFIHTVKSRIRILGYPLRRFEEIRLEVPDSRIRRILHMHPVSSPEAEGENAFEQLASVGVVLVATPRFLNIRAAASHVRAEIHQIVFDETPAAFVDESIECIERAGIIVIEPGGEYAVTAKLAPFFVGKDIVGVIGPCVVMLKFSDVLPGNVAACKNPNPSVFADARHLPQPLIELLPLSRPPP